MGLCRQDEIAEMKRKFKIMSHQIEQLKEDSSRRVVAGLGLVNGEWEWLRIQLMEVR